MSSMADRAMAPMHDAPPVFWINLQCSADRRARMQTSLDELGVRGHERVDAVDGADMQGYTRRSGVHVRQHPSQPPAVNACMASHVLAMLRFLESTPPSEPLALVMEDDVAFDYLPYWRKSLGRYLSDTLEAHPEAGIVQLAVMLANRADDALLDPDKGVPRPRPNWFSTAAYAVRREAAVAIVAALANRAPDGTVVIDLARVQHRTVEADVLLYDMIRTCTVPLFTFTCDMSYIHPSHVPSHQAHREHLLGWWREHAATAAVDRRRASGLL